VCIQRNIGIKQAVSPWIFLCDDDIEIRKDYLDVLADYIQRHPEAGAVSGVWLQKENDEWLASYPITSARELAWKYVFRLGIWGEIKCNSRNFFITRIKRSYEQKGNHISGAGWPVNTKFDGDSLQCPVYSLGAALVKREWLLQSPYDEALDRYGIGDNYGVIAGFYKPVVHIVNKAVIFHHREPANRLKRSLQYYRRTLALDYFIKTKPALSYANRYRLVWSLFGNLLMFIYKREGAMMKMSVKSIVQIAFNNNPYMKAARESKKVIEPV
jgi:glycosyltransferase involved in cell wall biosynthesis